MPGGPTSGGPTPGAPGGPSTGGPTGGFTPAGPGTSGPGNGFGPTSQSPSGHHSPGGDGQGGLGPMGGAPMGGGGAPGGRQGDGPSYTTGASTAAPSAFADPGTYTDPRGGQPAPDQRGVPSQPNQGYAPPPAAGGYAAPQPGGGGPSGRPEFGPGARPAFGPGANPNTGYAPDGGQRPESGGPRQNTGQRPEALNRPPQPGTPPRPDAGSHPGAPARPGTQPGGPTRPDAGAQPGGPRPDAGTPRPGTGAQPGSSTARPDTGTQPGSPRPDAGTQPGNPRPDTTAQPGGPRPDAGTQPGSPRPDAGTQPGSPRPDASTQPGGPRPDTTAQPSGPRPEAGTQPGGPRPDAGTTAPRPDAGPGPAGTRADAGTPPARPDADATPDATTRPDTHPENTPEPDVSRSPDDSATNPDQPINGEDSDGPTPDDDTPDTPDTPETDTDAPPINGEADDGPPVDEDGVPLNFLGNRQGEHPFADMGEYIPMGGDRSNGMGSYDQRVADLISDHNPWGEHGSREEFNAHHRPDGTYRTNRWPDNDGAVPGSERSVTLPEGTVLDRFGAEGGRFLSPLDSDGTPYHYGDRAIFPDNAEVGYHVYVVADPDGLPGTLADVAPALGQDGGGRQFTLPEDVTVRRLLDEGVLREVSVPPADGRVLPDSFGQDRGDGTTDTDTIPVADTGDTGDTGDAADTDRGDTSPLPDNLRQVADDSSFRTPAGAALFDQSDVRTRNAADAVTPIDGHFVLDVHSDGQHAFVGGQRLDGSDLADLARHLGWNGTDPIILNGCEAGRHADGLAADLARAANAQVIAPTERSWSGEQNTTPYSSSVDSVDSDGRARPSIPPDGGWRAFDPDGGMRDTGSNGLPVDTTGTPDGTPGDGPAPTPDGEGRPPLALGDDVDRGRIQSRFTPPAVTDPDAPHTIRVDDNAAADPADPHRPLRDGERLIGRNGLNANSQYHVPGRGTYYTNDQGVITHADLEVSNTRDGMKAAGADQNPDASYPEPDTTYRVSVGGAEHIYTTDGAGLPPRYTEWNPPQTNGAPVTFPYSDPNLPPNDPRVRPPTRGDALSDRACWPPHSEIVHTTPHGTTRLYTGDADPNTGMARVVAIDTWSSPGNGANNNVLVADLNPELNNFPPDTVTRINGEDVYVTNDDGVTYLATDERTYGHSAPRSQEAQDLVAALGSGTDGGHIRPTAADGAPDARNQFPQDSDENRPQAGQPSRETWYGQDREAGREQRRHTDHLWHDLETEGAHPAPDHRQPRVVHERWVMRDSSGRIRLHFRRYDN